MFLFSVLVLYYVGRIFLYHIITPTNIYSDLVVFLQDKNIHP